MGTLSRGIVASVVLRFARMALLGLLAVGVATLGACSSSSTAHGPDDAGGDATTTDASDGGVADTSSDVVGDAIAEDAIADGAGADAVDSAPCVGVLCNGVCLAASDCRTCTGATLLCGPTNTCVSSCLGNCGAGDAGVDAGTPMPIDCFACDQNGVNPLGTCQPDDPTKYCLNGRYVGQYVGGANGYICSCNDAGTSCPGATQVCAPLGTSTFCVTCGETTSSSLQDAGCQGGGSCNETAHTCL